MPILAVENSIVIAWGESKALDVVITKDGNPYDISNERLVFTMKKSVDDDLPLVQKDTADVAQFEKVDPLGGRARIYLLPSDTRQDPGEYLFDVWRELSPTDRTRVMKTATIKIEFGVTRFR